MAEQATEQSSARLHCGSGKYSHDMSNNSKEGRVRSAGAGSSLMGGSRR